MYLIELIIKKFFKKEASEANKEFPEELNPDEEAYRNCEKHLYLPIDSSCDFLACKNCGHIMRNPNKKTSRNIFKKFDNF